METLTGKVMRSPDEKDKKEHTNLKLRHSDMHRGLLMRIA